MRYGIRTALLDCILLVLILALFSILGCGNGSAPTTSEQVEQVQADQVAQVEQVQAEQAVPVEQAQADQVAQVEQMASVAVPAVIGMSFEEASAVLGGLGFVVTSGQDYSEKTAVGGICDQKPAGGSSVPQGSSVFIVVSEGTAWVTCSYCKGTGTVSERYTCPECGGSGLCDS